jgi:arginine/lysine/ornithine decarboxylase
LQDIENIEINLGAKNTNDVLKGSNLSKNKKLISPKSVNRVKIYPIPSETEYINLNFAEGKICASSLIPYPPGIPYVCPGEKISQEAIDYLKTMRDSGEKVIGINEDGEVLVGKYK